LFPEMDDKVSHHAHCEGNSCWRCGQASVY
jgi:hypothetical protein